MIGVARLPTSAEGPSWFGSVPPMIVVIKEIAPKAVLQSDAMGQNSFGIKPRTGPTVRRKVGRLRYHGLTVKHRTIMRQFNLRSCDLTNALVNK